MATIDQALAAKEKFKANFWKNNPEKYNVISIGVDEIIEHTENAEVITETFFVKAFLFEIDDVINLPDNIDGIEIRYLPVVEIEKDKDL